MLSESMAGKYARYMAGWQSTPPSPKYIKDYSPHRTSFYFDDGSAAAYDFSGRSPVLLSLRWERYDCQRGKGWS